MDMTFLPIRTLRWCRRGVVALLLLSALAVGWAQSYQWRDVVQSVDIQTDGTVIVNDERTLVVRGGDFNEAFICLDLNSGQSLELLDGGALGAGPSAQAYTQPCEDGSGGTELVVEMDNEIRITERRVFYRYALSNTLDYYSDVTQWQQTILESNHPPIRGYTLTLTAPGPMQAPYGAYVYRSGTLQDAGWSLSDDRSQLQVMFDRIPAGDDVAVRYLMAPGLFDQQGSRAGLEQLRRDATSTGTASGTASEFWAAPQTWTDNSLNWLRGVVPTNLSAADKILVSLIAVMLLFTVVTAVAVRRVRKQVAGNFSNVPQQPVFEPPSDLPPAVIGVMIESHFMLDTFYTRQGFRQSFAATVMDLARRGYLELHRSRRPRRLWQTAGTSGLTFRPDRDQNALLPLERKVLDYLQDAKQHSQDYLGPSERRDSNYLSFDQLKRYSLEQKWDEFTQSWAPEIYEYVWQHLGGMPFTYESMKAMRYWRTMTMKWGLALSFFSAVLLLVPMPTRIVSAWLLYSFPTHLAIFVAFLFISIGFLHNLNFINTKILALRAEVAPEVHGWLGFKRTLSYYSVMRDAPDNFFLLWDRHFCYAATFGVAQEFLRNVHRIIDFSESDLTMHVSWMDSFDDIDDFSSFFDVANSLSDTLDSLSDSTGDSSDGGDGGDGGGGE